MIKNKAYQEGYDYYTSSGRDIVNNCPYTKDSEEQSEWMRGFNEAEIENNINTIFQIAYENGGGLS